MHAAKEARQQLNGIRNHGYQQLIDALQLQQDESSKLLSTFHQHPTIKFMTACDIIIILVG